MKIKLNQYENWVSDDPAEINFGAKSRGGGWDVYGIPVPPNEVAPAAVMRCCANTGDGLGRNRIDLSKLVYLRTIVGSVRNGETSRSYTTEHQNYHLYRYDRLPGEPRKFWELVIVSVNGAGNQWYLVGYLDVAASVLTMAETLPNDSAWDVLHALATAYRKGHEHGTQEATQRYRSAFVEGRLKKRKQRGQNTYKVEIQPKSA